MSDLLPLFPLPNVVLFPNVFLPLHVFEQRYRDMVTDVLAEDRLIGMVLLRPGWQRDYDQSPAVYPIGSSGLITHVERMRDGRYNIVLRGVERFRIVREEAAVSYRRAVVEPLPERPLETPDRVVVRGLRAKLEALVGPALRRSVGSAESGDVSHALSAAAVEAELRAAAMGDEDLINALAQYLDLEPLEKQALLERDCLRSRASSLVELLEMKILMARIPGVSHSAH